MHDKQRSAAGEGDGVQLDCPSKARRNWRSGSIEASVLALYGQNTDRFGTPVGECPIRCARPWRLVINAVHWLAVFPQRPGSQLIHEHSNLVRCFAVSPEGCTPPEFPQFPQALCQSRAGITNPETEAKR